MFINLRILCDVFLNHRVSQVRSPANQDFSFRCFTELQPLSPPLSLLRLPGDVIVCKHDLVSITR